MGAVATPDWPATNALLSQFGRRHGEARQGYRQFVQEGLAQGSLWLELRQQIYLGDDAFVKRVQFKDRARGHALGIPRAQRRAPAPSLAAMAAMAKQYHSRDAAVVAAYATGACSYREIAESLGVHLARVGRIVRKQML